MARGRWVLVLLMVLAVELLWVSPSSQSAAEVSAADEKDVVVLDVANFTKTVEAHDFVLVEFYAPWCGHCKRLTPEYAKAATELKSHDPPIVLAKVDANEEENKPLAAEHGIRGFPTLKFFKNGGKTVSDYTGPREAAGIVAHLKKLVGPPSVQLSSIEEADEIIKKSPLTVVGLFKSTDDKEYTNYVSVADELRSDYQFVHTLDSTYVPEKGVVLSAPAVRLYKSFDEGFNDAIELSVDALKAFLEEKSSPLVTEMNKNPASNKFLVKFFNSVATKVFLLLDLKAESADSYRSAYTELAKSSQSKGLRFLIADAAENENAVKYFGVRSDGLPAIVVQDKEGSEKYIAHDIKAAEISTWLQDYLDGKVEPSVKSDEIPEKNDSPVKVVVRKNFNEMVLDSGKNVLIEFYAPWCGHCKKLAPTLDELAIDFEDETDVVIAKMDATTNDVPSGKFDVKGFPTLYLHTASGENIQYNGDRSKTHLKEFINKHRSDVLKTGASADEAKVKDEL